jgi:hypothetical protein
MSEQKRFGSCAAECSHFPDTSNDSLECGLGALSGPCFRLQRRLGGCPADRCHSPGCVSRYHGLGSHFQTLNTAKRTTRGFKGRCMSQRILMQTCSVSPFATLSRIPARNGSHQLLTVSSRPAASEHSLGLPISSLLPFKQHVYGAPK